jgi:biopolymer transport protein ExbD
MSRRKRFKPNIKKTSVFGLNINSMTDMFTIMLVFLLQNYSTSQVEIIPEKGMRLPASNSTSNPVEGIRLSLSKDELKVGKESVSRATDAKDGNFIPALFTVLDKMAKEDAVNEKQKPHVKEGRILLQADESVPYAELRKVMYTASMAGFPQLKLITMVGN